MSTCISSHGEFSSHDAGDDLTCRLCGVFDETGALERIERLTAIADRLAATVVLLAHDAHPVYGSTAGWRGGIGGQAMTPGCSILNPPPGEGWTQYDLPTGPARDWFHGRDIDLNAIKAELKAEWRAQLGEETP